MTSMISKSIMVGFLLSTPVAADAAPAFNVLASFKGSNGGYPQAGLIFDKAGNLYGTTSAGGSFDLGTVFELSPPAPGKSYWSQKTLYVFNGGFGAYPEARLVFDGSGNLYGTTAGGGQFNLGTVFKLSPPSGTKVAWTETVLYSFDGTHGSIPLAGLIFDTAGNLYGTAYHGGQSNTGTVFELTPPAAGNAWTATVLVSFNGPNGSYPEGGLIADAKGNLYGTTRSGGLSFRRTTYGTVFELSPPASGSRIWTQNVIASFEGVDGWGPEGGLIMDGKGNLYGTTFEGGGSAGGAVFQLIPPAQAGAAWTKNDLYAFATTSFGNVASYAPVGDLVMDSSGNLYGATYSGTAYGYGAVFQLSPPAAGGTDWSEFDLVAFNGSNGGNPAAGPTIGAQGVLYGTTFDGVGRADEGTVFEFTPINNTRHSADPVVR